MSKPYTVAFVACSLLGLASFFLPFASTSNWVNDSVILASIIGSAVYVCALKCGHSLKCFYFGSKLESIATHVILVAFLSFFLWLAHLSSVPYLYTKLFGEITEKSATVVSISDNRRGCRSRLVLSLNKAPLGLGGCLPENSYQNLKKGQRVVVKGKISFMGVLPESILLVKSHNSATK
jgi:hypothetical protein